MPQIIYLEASNERDKDFYDHIDCDDFKRDKEDKE